jgi:hypothetical protein
MWLSQPMHERAIVIADKLGQAQQARDFFAIYIKRFSLPPIGDGSSSGGGRSPSSASDFNILMKKYLSEAL